MRAGPDAVPSSVRRFMRRARRRRLRAAVPWAVTAAVLVFAGLAAWLFYGSALLGVKEVRVTGTDLLSPEQVRQVVAVPLDIPMARVDLAAVRQRVEALAEVDRVTVTRQWPNTLLVAVRERSAVAVVPQGKRYVLVDGEGVAYRVVVERPDGLPFVRLGDPRPEDLATRSALQVLGALTEELRGQLTELVVEAPARIRLQLRDDREIIWGDSTESATKAKVATLLLAREGKTIDVSAPDVVTIR
ncbi:MAG TPA: FtsQ-type POTRA domain-containing protein [Pilimelia sp.]|nr:FtsQ-type POTRA domain-containing protein [Pilimelia sp.]